MGSCVAEAQPAMARTPTRTRKRRATVATAATAATAATLSTTSHEKEPQLQIIQVSYSICVIIFNFFSHLLQFYV